MRRFFLTILAFFASTQIFVSTQTLGQESEYTGLKSPVNHSLKVFLDPVARTINVEDTISLPTALRGNSVLFELNSNLAITETSGELLQISSNSVDPSAGLNGAGGLPARTAMYSLSSDDNDQFRLVYSGSIYDIAEQTSEEYAQSFSETSGIIGEQGVYLNYGSAWFPILGDSLVTFDLEVKFSSNASTWKAVSQGDRNGGNAWINRDPMEEIYLIAADFTEYSVLSGDVEVLAYLRTPDSNLATKYMDATERYLNLYEPMLGEYPYSKFALVENFWETGYGMPSFTLLGEQIIPIYSGVFISS